MELRDVEIFLTLAEELHFGRTAARLHVTQARVSQAIKQQERRIGGLLFDRSSRRNVRLTPLGEQLRDDLGPHFSGMHAGFDRARQAAQGIKAVLRIGVINSNHYELRPFFDAFRARHRQWGVRVRHAPFIDLFGGLRRGEMDVLIAPLPVDEPDLTTGPILFTEPRVILSASDHHLARRDCASVEDLADFQVLTGRTVEPEYCEEVFIPFATPRGRTIERGDQRVTNLDEICAEVASGDHVMMLGAHVGRFHSRPDIAYIPVRDAPTMRWAMVWRNESEAIHALAAVAHDLGAMTL
ncbi:LysR family transcriptional regulator [Nocardia cyriacigeorgica]|uniref:LysR substrate-binding domain-containing protein n=1 Tax=Nocardia cyriacigeorgica TaxID=135487 RepID=UPI00245788C8|nr:LysR family transcriptional regulator [Nocardia cyriacigeorgica]